MTRSLPDVNVLLAFAWDTHADHGEVRRWFAGSDHFATCPITELGFLRVSMSPAYSATFQDALSILKALRGLPTASRIDDDFDVISLPEVSRYKGAADVYLVHLAEAHGMRLATLDKGILSSKWGSRLAFNPLAP